MKSQQKNRSNAPIRLWILFFCALLTLTCILGISARKFYPRNAANQVKHKLASTDSLATSSLTESRSVLYETSQWFDKPLDQSSAQGKIRSLGDNLIHKEVKGELLETKPKIVLLPLLSNSVASRLDSFKLLPKERQIESINVLQFEMLLMTNDQVI